MTPSTRKEIYLNKIATGEGAVPTPATREEMYLAKIAGEEIEVPTPATRVEMYLYKIGGGEIIVPTPATRLEIFLAAASGMPISTPAPATREEILWDYIINGTNPQTIIGIPPISFTGNGTPLISWSMKGNGVQSGTPTPDNPVMPTFCGTLDGADWTIPITCGGETTTLNLTQTNRTRKILKRVLNGSETWDNAYGASLFGMVEALTVPFIQEADALCTHYKYNSVQSGLDATMHHGEFALQKSQYQYKLFFKNTDFTSASDFKAWIASEYAAGRPVTVWYARETAAFVMANEPLAKIGDYFDELSSTDAGVSIPTAKGSNTLTVDTELQPSEMTITGYIAESQTMTAAKIMARASGMNVNDKELESLSKKELNSILKGTVKSDGRSARSNG